MVQTISKGGKAVYIARNLIAQMNDSMVYDDADVCLQLGIFRTLPTGKGNSMLGNNFIIIPNPATNLVTIILDQETVEKCNLKIIDKLSKAVYTKLISKGTKQLQINIANLNAGVYQVVIESSEFIANTAKLVIIK